MAYFAWGINRPGVQDARAAIIQKHWDFIAGYDDKLIARGPLLDDRDVGQVLGSIHIVELADSAAFETFVHDEPFAAAGLFAEIVTSRFAPGLARTQFAFQSQGDLPRFFIHCPAAPGAAPTPAQADAHAAHCARHDANIVCHGALLADDGDWQGQAYFVEFPTKDDAARFAAADPYAIAGLYDRVETHRWTMGGPQKLSARGALD
ncbi:MAG: YciI family protein [Rhodospirillaceae bacterium]